jgi:hypothetical protein
MARWPNEGERAAAFSINHAFDGIDGGTCRE